MVKKAQEEMIGFVLIVVLVSVIGLIFLVISLRKPVEATNSKEVEDFLYSSMMATTSCKSDSGSYNFQDLIVQCYRNQNCIDETSSCEVLNKTSIEMIETLFPIGQESKYKAYKFVIKQENQTVLNIAKGNFTGSGTVGSDILIPVSGANINVKLELTY